jgi:hypothetical protein
MADESTPPDSTAAFLHTLWLRDQRPGNYEFTAVVRGAGGRVLGTDHARVGESSA